MASEIDICNLSLSHLGETANISSIDPPEGSSYAESLARFYPIARDITLQAFPWGFAMARDFLALLQSPGDEGNPYNVFVYAKPADCLEPVAVLMQGAEDKDAQPFDTEANQAGTEIIICDVPQAILKYTRIITDTTKFSPMMVDALAWLLASYMAGPIIKGDAGTAKGKECLAIYQTQIANAEVTAMRGRKVRTGYGEHEPDWLQARNSGAGRHTWGR
jgi:hypothetical protein